MNSRWQDTPLAVLLRLLADLMIANMLGLICSFGVVTAGAGLSAMYAVLFQRERDGGTVSAVKTFFHAFRKNFWQATLLEVIVAFAAAVAVVDFRFALLLVLQTGFFTAMFMALPSVRNGFWESLPGALLASVGWLVFSRLYSIYVAHFAHLSNIYGSVYAVALSMLWLYCCISIVFYGGALNRLLDGWNRHNSGEIQPEDP